jgi:hypothetical protein
MSIIKKIILATLFFLILAMAALPVLDHLNFKWIDSDRLPKDAELYKFWNRMFILIYAVFAALAFEAIGRYSNSKLRDFNDEKGVEGYYALNNSVSRWLSLAMYLWALSSIIKIFVLLKAIPETILPPTSAILSSLNSMCLLWGLLYLEMDFSGEKRRYLFPRIWEEIGKNTDKYRKLTGLLTAVVIFVEIVLSGRVDVITNPKEMMVFLPDMVLTLSVCFVLCTGLYNVSMMRGLPVLSGIALLTGFTVLASQIINLLPAKDPSSFFAPVNGVLSITYTSFMITLLFALELSWIGWKRSRVTEEKAKLLLEKVEELRAATEQQERQALVLREKSEEITNKKLALEAESEINRGFIVLVSLHLKSQSLREALHYCLDLLKSKGIYDYAFAVGIYSMSKGKLEFPFYFVDDAEIEDKAIPLNNTFGGYAFIQNEEVIVDDAYDPKQQADFGVDKLRFAIAPDSKSLIYIPLIKDYPNAIPFGVMTIQSRTAHRRYEKEELAMIRAIAYLLGQIVHPNITDKN